MMDLFPNTRSVLDEFENAHNTVPFKDYKDVTQDEEDTLVYFSVHLAKALMQDHYIDAENIAKIILAAKDLSSEITVKIR